MRPRVAAGRRPTRSRDRLRAMRLGRWRSHGARRWRRSRSPSRWSVGGCGASRADVDARPPPTETADTVCTLLRGWNNDLTEVFNATSAADHRRRRPGDRRRRARRRVRRDDRHRRGPPGRARRPRPARGRRAGRPAGRADRRAPTSRSPCSRTSATRPPPCRRSRSTTRAAPSAARRWASSGRRRSLEPTIGAYDDEDLRAAFAADEDCPTSSSRSDRADRRRRSDRFDRHDRVVVGHLRRRLAVVGAAGEQHVALGPVDLEGAGRAAGRACTVPVVAAGGRAQHAPRSPVAERRGRRRRPRRCSTASRPAPVSGSTCGVHHRVELLAPPGRHDERARRAGRGRRRQRR